ncbi:MAG: calcium-binding protein [Pseudomonadota bacterium]
MAILASAFAFGDDGTTDGTVTQDDTDEEPQPPEIGPNTENLLLDLPSDAVTGPITQIGYEEDDRFEGGAFNDILSGNGGDDVLLGQGGDDRLSGGSGADVLEGGAGNDTLRAGTGNDQLLGGDGADDLAANSGDNLLDGGTGADTLRAGEGTDQLFGGEGKDLLLAGAGSAELNGGADADHIIGLVSAEPGAIADGIDLLKGGLGDDILVLGAGDEATGGQGGDRFVVGEWSAQGLSSLIKDFDSSEDQLTLVLTSDTTLQAPHLQINQSSADTRVLLNGQELVRLEGTLKFDPSAIEIIGLEEAYGGDLRPIG